MSKPILELKAVHTHVGSYHILQGVSFVVPENQISVILGRNGAGKTTTLRTIMGLWKANAGAIHFDGKEITSAGTPDISRNGVAYVPENMGIFRGLTVHENLVLGTRTGHFDTERLETTLKLFPPLKTFWKLQAGNLSGGQKQMLSIARAMLEPRKLIIIDEPTKGIAPAIVDDLVEAFLALKRSQTSILLVEQNFAFASEVGDHVAVMDGGQIIHAGPMGEISADATLQERYLGLAVEDQGAIHHG